MRGSSLPSLTSLRFFAAALVAIHHLYHIPVGGAYSPDAVGPGKLGFVGVTFFFILSGFVLTWTWKRHERMSLFYGRRFARVYPLAALVTVLALGFYAAKIEPFTFRGYDALFVAQAVALFTLVQTWVPKGEFHQAFNSPAWSLSNEVFFYLLFPWLVPVLERLRARTVAIGSLVWLLGLGLLGYVIGPARLYSFPPYRIGEFIVGIALALAIKQGRTPRLPLPIGVAIAVGTYLVLFPIDAVTGGLLMGNRPLTGALTSASFAALIWSAIGHDLAGHKGILHSKPLVKLGQWSFALYLIHDLCYRSVVVFFTPHTSAQRYAAAIVTLVLAQALAALLYEFVERPVERAIRNRLHQSDSKIATMDHAVDREPHPAVGRQVP